MTSWQGNEGWNPQQDPYGQQQGQPYYGSDPYPSPQYGADPYNPYGPSGTAAFPAYQSGYGAPPPPPPPKRSRLPIIVSLAAILAVVGTVITIVLINRQDDPEPAASSSPTSSTRPKTSTRPSLPSTSRRPTTSVTRPPTRNGWTTITMVGGTYQVPPDWRKANEKRKSGLDVDFDGGAENGGYTCGGDPYFRGFTASGEVQSKNGATLDLNKTVADFAQSFAKQYYNNPKIDLPPPTAVTPNGQRAATVTAKVTVTPTKPECEATAGEVAVLGVQIEKAGKPTGVRMVVVVNDLAGGPATPPALPDPLAEQILETVSVS